MNENKNNYSWISSDHIIAFGDSQDIISFHCFIVSWVILLYASLLWIDGSYCTRIILLALSYCKGFIATTAVLMFMPKLSRL